MRRLVKHLLIFLLLSPLSSAYTLAQTATPTPSPTPTPTPAVTNLGLAPVGALMIWAGEDVPLGWLMADGSGYFAGDYPALYAAIGCTWGCEADEGGDVFYLPDLRGRVPMGAGTGAGLTNRILATQVGAETHVLTLQEMPSHQHGQRVLNNQSAYAYTAAGVGFNAAASVNTNQSVTRLLTDAEGGGMPHNNVQPSLVVNFIIWSGSEETPLGGGSDMGGTPGPEISVYSTVAPGGGDGQNVAFTYEVTAGDFGIIALLFLGISLSLINTLFVARRRS